MQNTQNIRNTQNTQNAQNNQILTAIIGLQFGDEGKGKIVDKLVAQAKSLGGRTVVVRFQGGTNAGHTIYAKDVNGKLIKFVTHAAPTGLATDSDIAIGPNVAFDPEVFVDEINQAKEFFNYKGKIMISERTGILLDYHRKLDAFKEAKDKNIGTTKSGIGPFYKDNADRLCRITFNDYVSDNFSEKLKEVLHFKKLELEAAGIMDDLEKYHAELLSAHEKIRAKLKPFKVRLEYRLNDYMNNGDHIIIEGAQGSNLDVDMGTIPDVTSSHLLAPHAFPGLGLPRSKFKIYGIEKFYPTRVGNGILPTLDEDEFGQSIVKNAGEFGATTGRQRRVGYPDWVLIKRSTMINDCDGIFLTRADNMQGYNFKAGIAYEFDDGVANELPLDFSTIKKPIYSQKIYSFDLWEGPEDLSDAIKVDDILREKRDSYVKGGFDSLPDGLKEYVKDHDEFVGCPIVGISIGPGRDEMVERITK